MGEARASVDEAATPGPDARRPIVSRASWLVALPVGFTAAVLLVAAGPSGAHGFFGHGDAPSFLAVARDPFGSGHGLPGDPLAQGVAYRFGRVLLPLAAWLLVLGRSARVQWSLAAVYAASLASWVAVAAEHLRRSSRRPALAWSVLAVPFVVLWIASPTIVSEPMAGALVLLAYLFDRDGREVGARVAAAAAILARETMVVAILPLLWRAWRDDGRRGITRWSTAAVPYALWTLWVRVRVGQFPFLDPASNRRDALAPPFVGWWQTLHRPLDNGQQYGLIVAVLTIAIAVAVATRSNAYRPLAWAALTASALAVCYGWAVWQYPSEALRVLAPAQVLLLVAALEAFAPPAGAGSRDGRVIDLRDGARPDPVVAAGRGYNGSVPGVPWSETCSVQRVPSK